MPRPALFLVKTRVDPDRLAEWEAWHRSTHVPEVLTEGEFVRARRLKATEGEEGHPYWTLYEAESAEALETYRKGPNAARLRASHDVRFGSATDLERATFEVLDDLHPVPAQTEAAMTEGGLHLLFRPARPSDEAVVLALIRGSREAGSRDDPSDAEIKAGFTRLLSTPTSAVFVAEIEGKVGAMIALNLTSSLRAGLRAHIADLVVDEALRSRGVGQRLVTYADRWARRQGATELAADFSLHREASRRFYTREGFVDASLFLRKRLPRTPPSVP